MEKEADPGAGLLVKPIRQEAAASHRERYFTRSLTAMRCRNAAMSARAIWS